MNDGTQIKVVEPGQGECYSVVGDQYRFLAVSGDTGGSYAIWHSVVLPGGGPPPHVHSREQEGFYVLKGEMTFYAPGEIRRAGPGTFINLPPGVPHRFQNETDTPAEMLILVAPGGFEKMFFEVGAHLEGPDVVPSPPTEEEIEKLVRVSEKYGVTIGVEI
jgi:quercetin dioxygenase-like cupin family protein